MSLQRDELTFPFRAGLPAKTLMNTGPEGNGMCVVTCGRLKTTGVECGKKARDRALKRGGGGDSKCQQHLVIRFSNTNIYPARLICIARIAECETNQKPCCVL